MLLASDQALIERVVTADCHDSFGILVERHQSDLRYSLRQMTGWNEALADDLAQETFIQAFKSLKNYQGTAKFGSRVLTVIKLQEPVPFWKEVTIEMLGALIGCALAYSFFPFNDLIAGIPTKFVIGPSVLLSIAGVISCTCAIAYWTAERSRL
jgi:hypothetical protein